MGRPERTARISRRRGATEESAAQAEHDASAEENGGAASGENVALVGSADTVAVDELRAELDAAENSERANLGASDPEDPKSTNGDGLPDPDPAMIGLCKMVVKVGGRVVCQRALVSPLTPQEVHDMGHAFAVFAKVWGVSIGDPRVASAVLLAGTAGVIVLPRIEEHERNMAARASAEQSASATA